MSVEIIEKKPPILKEKIDDDDDYFNYPNVVVPFSDFFHKIELLDVYSGVEDIPFEERAPEYKKILLAEFL
ncbi:MAG: hypothetical protein HWN79_07660 [Candidatus Lokiarchaeota archaeon]|nr:hypothetical protein [Candidatus Lokiarchaeota archaeon]